MDKMKHCKSLIPLLTVILLAIPVLAIAGQFEVIRVVDGDTIVIRYNGEYEKVRFLCVNTPESVHSDKTQNIPMGKVASRYVQQFVDLEFEVDRLRGNHGRLLAYIFVNGQNFNLELVKRGLSPYYTKYGRSKKYHAEFKAAEKKARKGKRNIWGDPELTKKYLRLKSKWGQ
jgi:micrococcal nuclease